MTDRLAPGSLPWPEPPTSAVVRTPSRRPSRPAPGCGSLPGRATIYRRHNKPALGPVGESLDDLARPFGGNAV
jgi:hypothetical protein